MFVLSTKLLNVFLQVWSTHWRASPWDKLTIRRGDVRVVPIGHRQIEEASNLVQLLNPVGEIALSVGRCLQCEENIILVGTPVW